MNETQTKQTRVRGSMTAHAIERPRPPPGSPDPFAFRVANQQFMNDFSPLFEVMARRAANPDRLVADGALSDAIRVATGLAKACAAKLTGKADPTPRDVRSFRRAAVEVVSQTWEAGALSEMDVGSLASEMADAFALVDPEGVDRTLFDDKNVSSEASLAMTSANVALVLTRPVMAYGFRRPPADLIGALASSVVHTASEAATRMAPYASKSDRLTVMQTLSNRFATLMAEVYGRKARHFVSHTEGMPEDEREAFAADYDAAGEISDEFRSWAVVMAATSLAYAKIASAVVAQDPTTDAKSPGA